jgi:N-methylhydantoinase A
MRVSVWGSAPAARMRSGAATPPSTELREIVFDGDPVTATVLRGELPPGTRLRGPALCALPESTLLVPPGWCGTVDEQGTIHLHLSDGADEDADVYRLQTADDASLEAGTV